MNKDIITPIECEFNDLFNGLSYKEKMEISNHIFNNGLPGFPHLFIPVKGLRLGQHFLNVLPAQFKCSVSNIFFSNDSELLKIQISAFVQKIFNDPIQNQRSE